MELFKAVEEMEHEQVVFCNDKISGLKAIVAIHDTTLGPALGGARMWDYRNEDEALRDVLRLSRGMTYKAAVAGLNLGGGKAVIIGEPKKLKSEVFFRTFGRFVDGLGGRYITAEDVNINVRDMEYVAMETSFVTGLSSYPGGSGDPSPMTALGVFHGIRAAVKHRLNRPSLQGLSVAIQGCGAVGHHLCELLAKEGVKLFVSDIDHQKVENAVRTFGAKACVETEIYSVAADIFAPCALGATLNSETIPQLKATIVSGAANNQLQDEKVHGKMILDRKILYSPDYVINAGGLINVYHELRGYNREAARAQVSEIYNTLLRVYQESDQLNVSTHVASARIAEKRIADIRAARQLNHAYANATWARRRHLSTGQ